ncbi:amidase signature domain-containing protein [Xylaria sp. FL0064]|nr:amidase signature domain-containing protein [Xylaria sp. FL0064]
MDQERSSGTIRSRLHGIPFLVKDNIWTAESFKLPTTCGAVAFEHTFAKQNADIVQKLIDAGMVLLGKTNLSELAFVKSSHVWGGWSAVGGQTQSPYVAEGIDPGDTSLGHSTPAGSSAGSAVAVAAGMAPVALATETNGSIVIPADRASLYSIRLSPSSISTRGMLTFNKLGDSLGWMTKSAEDAALMLNIVLGSHDYTQYLRQCFKGLRIGFLNPMDWQPGAALVKPDEDYNKQFMAEFNNMLPKLELAGAVVHRNIDLRRWSEKDEEMFNALSCEYTLYLIHHCQYLRLMAICTGTMHLGLSSLLRDLLSLPSKALTSSSSSTEDMRSGPCPLVSYLPLIDDGSLHLSNSR